MLPRLFRGLACLLEMKSPRFLVNCHNTPHKAWKERKKDKDKKTNLSTNDEASWKVMILPYFFENLKCLIGQFSCRWYNSEPPAHLLRSTAGIQGFQHLKKEKNPHSISPSESQLFDCLGHSKSEAPSKQKAYHYESQSEETVCFVSSFPSIHQSILPQVTEGRNRSPMAAQLLLRQAMSRLASWRSVPAHRPQNIFQKNICHHFLNRRHIKINFV